jgi:hypothetical protein
MPIAPPSIDVDDQLSLAEFVELWWAHQVPVTDAESGVLAKFLDRKQAALRMLRRSPQRPGFPEPTGTSGRTRLYRLGDLVSWIASCESNHEAVTVALGDRPQQVPPSWHVRRAVDACAVELDAELARRLAVAVTLALDCQGTESGHGNPVTESLEALSAEHDVLSRLRSESSAIEASHPDLDGVFAHLLSGMPTDVSAAGRLLQATASALSAGLPAARLADATLERLSSAPAVGGGSGLTGTGLVRLMVAAGDPRPGESALDLAAGEGSLLLYVAESAGDNPRLAGFEPDSAKWAIAKGRFHLHRLPVDLHHGMSLDGGETLPTADLVLVDPPLDHRSDYPRWLALAANCCTPTGRAVVCLPRDSRETSNPGWATVGSEFCDVLITVPNRLRTDHGEGMVLWVLDREPKDQVLLVDASNVGHQRGALNEVDAEHESALRLTVREWRRSNTASGSPPIDVVAVARWDMDIDKSQPSTDITDRGPARSEVGGDSGGLEHTIEEAKAMADRLSALVEGPLRPYTSEEHRRALARLSSRLRRYLNAGELEASDLRHDTEGLQ